MATLNAQNPPPSFSHVWTLDGVANGNTLPTQMVSTATPGTDTYEVTVTNITTVAVNGWSRNHHHQWRWHFTLARYQHLSLRCCKRATRYHHHRIGGNNTTAYPYFSYFVSGTQFCHTTKHETEKHYWLTGGNYSILVQDDISHCTDSKNATVSDPRTHWMFPNTTTCSTSVLAATTNANAIPVAGNFTYRVFNSGGTQVDA